MFEVHFTANDESDYGLYNYTAIGSKQQVIEGARIKSMQIPMLKYKEWLVLIKKDGVIVATRAIKNAQIV